jgi:hypothetical protein
MGVLLRAGLSLGVSQVRSKDKMTINLQMAALLFYYPQYNNNFKKGKKYFNSHTN